MRKRGAFPNRDRYWLMLLVGMFLLSSACVSRPTIYLDPSRYHAEMSGQYSEQAKIYYQPFQVKFSQRRLIGKQQVADSIVELKTDPYTVGKVMDTLVQNRLVEANKAFAPAQDWDMTVEGLQSQPMKQGIVVSGRINRLWIAAQTGLTRTNTEYVLEIDVDAFIGFLDMRKVERRSVRIQEKVLKLSSSSATMEKLLSDLLANAASEVAGDYLELM